MLQNLVEAESVPGFVLEKLYSTVRKRSRGSIQPTPRMSESASFESHLGR